MCNHLERCADGLIMESKDYVSKLTTPEAYATLPSSLLLWERRSILCARTIFPPHPMVSDDCRRGSMPAHWKGVEVLQVRLGICLRSAEQ